MVFSMEVIAQYFDKPIIAAAKELNIGLAVLRSQCRYLGIQRWPHRKLKSIQALIDSIEAENGGAQGDEYMQEILQTLKKEKKQIKQMPDLQLAEETKRWRQVNFKAKYKKRKVMALILSLTNKTTTNVGTHVQSQPLKNDASTDTIEDGYCKHCAEQEYLIGQL